MRVLCVFDEEVTVEVNLEVCMVLCAFLAGGFRFFVLGVFVAASPLSDGWADPMPHVRTFRF